jgi:hypothetical protein
MDTDIIVLIASFVLFFAVLYIVPRLGSSSKKIFDAAIKGLIDDYFVAHADKDLERHQLRFHKLTIATDRVMGQVMSYYGCKDSSVKQQLRQGLERKVITYDQFQILKRFHHMRNEVVHEGLVVQGENEGSVYNALTVIRSLLA